ASAAPVTDEQIEEIERLVNAAVIQNHDVAKYERNLDEAKRAGVTALFGEKYGERVRVVDIAGFSRELCGGTHVERTGDIGPFKVVQETAVQAGVRRIVAVTGPAAVETMIASARRRREARIGGVLLYLESHEGATQDDLRARWDELKTKAPVAAVLVAASDGKVALLAGASKDVASPGFKATIENAAKDAGGRAGGKP